MTNMKRQEKIAYNFHMTWWLLYWFVFFLEGGRKGSKLNSGEECKIKNSLFQKLTFLQGVTAELRETNLWADSFLLK